MSAGVIAGELTLQCIMFDDAGNALPQGQTTFRVYWNAPSPDDQLVGVVGSPSNPMNVEVSGGTFFDSDNFLATSRPPSFGLLGMPGFEELSYDSWFSIGNSSLDVGPAWPSGFAFEDQVITAPGTSFDAGGATKWQGGPGGPDNVAWTVPPTLEDPGGGGVVPTPQTVAGNWPNQRVLLMQFTVIHDAGTPGIPMVVGTMGILTVVDGEATETQGTFAHPTPGTLAVLALAGFAGVRRRRR
jgi:uncharacterized protein (TIGR03382 family)